MLRLIKLLLTLSAILIGHNVIGQGISCETATPAMVGLNVADGPNSGLGALDGCGLVGSALHADWYNDF